jgi:hypothetical protein
VAGVIGAVPSAGGNLTGGVNEARSNITQHATTMDLFAITAPAIRDGAGSAVTITAIVNAPQAGAKRRFYPLVNTVITHGATFSVDGNATYTTAAGDCLEFEAITVSTFDVHIIKQDGTAVVASDATLTTTDITTNDVTSSKHGFCPKAPADATKFLNGANPPAYSVPVGTLTAGTPCVQNPYTPSVKTAQTHGKTVKPVYVDFYIECLTAEQNFGVGERIGANNFNTTSSAGSPLYSYDVNQVNILSPTGGLVALNGASPASGVALTAANWKVVAQPYFLN